MTQIPLGRSVVLRDETASDTAFTAALFAADRGPMFAAGGWPASTVSGILASQYALQDAHFRRVYPSADRWIVARGGNDIGRLIVDRSGARWTLVDILIAREAQGRGAGTVIIDWIAKDACRAGVTAIGLSVALDNPRAEMLYRRLGFVDALSASATHRAMVRAVS